MDAPHSVHYAAILRILRYVKGTLYHGLHYSSRSSLKFHAYLDADWAGDPTDRCSITSFCFLLGTSLISWCSKKQDMVSHSSTEAEYHALANTTCNLSSFASSWLTWMLYNPLPLLFIVTIVVLSTLRTKHIEIDCHITRQHLKKGNLKLFSIFSADQPTDIFTKTHPPGHFRDLISKLQLASSLLPQF